jgi:hypothetical protein
MANTIMPTVFSSGVRRMHTLSGWPMLGAMGTAVDPSTIADLVANGGYDMGTINALIGLSATNEQLLALPYPAPASEQIAAINALMAQLGGPTGGIPSAPSPAPGPASSGGNVLRAGSQLSYTATWGNTFPSWNDPNTIQSRIQTVLAQQWGIVIDNQFHTTSDVINFSGQSGFTLQVHTNRDYGNAGDVKSIIDGALYSAGVSLKSSTIALTVTGQTPLVTGPFPGAAGTAIAMTPSLPPGATNWSAWLQTNMPLLIFAVAGMVILPPLLRRR